MEKESGKGVPTGGVKAKAQYKWFERGRKRERERERGSCSLMCLLEERNRES